ncbi:MAG TPA: nucleotide exchange factor GrpE [Candidatus Bathyarchaeia archaeon]|nr:nucleotide exchange factor GrpE [Candidatus Bathyarchaeia archaeon]
MGIKKREENKNLEQRVVVLEEKLKRALADYDNLGKRVLAEKQQFIKFAKAEVLDKFIAVLDDLERAEAYLKNEGLSLATAQFRAVLNSEGVKCIEVKGKVFDPEKMDCVTMVEGPKNRVVNVVQKGYLLNDKVIRPVKVEVGRGKTN